jgi:hypothetical protein
LPVAPHRHLWQKRAPGRRQPGMLLAGESPEQKPQASEGQPASTAAERRQLSRTCQLREPGLRATYDPFIEPALSHAEPVAKATRRCPARP